MSNSPITPEEHAANGPETWQVVKVMKGHWRLLDANGDTIDTYATKRDAEAATTIGWHAKHWHDKRRWYAGEPPQGIPAIHWKPYAQILEERAKRAAWLESKRVKAGE